MPTESLSAQRPAGGLALGRPGGPVRAARESVATVLMWAAGALALMLGLLVYVTDRPAASAQWWPWYAAVHGGPVFGAVGAWLPSAVHAFAFSLFTAAALPRTGSPAYGACAAWWLVNVVFEVGQHPAVRGHLSTALQDALGNSALARSLSNYFLHGRFDVGDLLAATTGALAACLVLRTLHRWEAQRVR